MKDLEREHPYLISQYNRTFVATYELGDFLDLKALEVEDEIIGQRRSKAYDNLISVVNPFRTPAEGKRWIQLASKLIAIEDEKRASVGRESEANESVSSYEVMINFATAAGLSLLHRDITNQMQVLADRAGFGPIHAEYAEAGRLIYEGRLVVQVGESTIPDFEKFDPKDPHSPSKAFNFLARSQTIRAVMAHDEVISEGQPELIAQFPNLCKLFIEEESGDICAAVNLGTDTLKEHISKKQGIEKEALQRFERFFNKVHGLRETIYKSLLDPDSLNFSEISSKLLFYIERYNRIGRVSVLQVAGLREITHTYELYRGAFNFVQEGRETDFYSHLMAYNKEYVDS